MVDIIQILITVVITTLTVLLVIIGIEVFRILQDAKKTLVRMNNVLDDVEVITQSVAGPVSKLSELAEGIQHGIGIINVVTRILETRNERLRNNHENKNG